MLRALLLALRRRQTCPGSLAKRGTARDDRAIDVFGSKTGIVCGDLSFTYGEFGNRCEKLATGLPKFGVTSGDRVAYLSFNTHRLLEGYFGVVQARGIVRQGLMNDRGRGRVEDG